jgi:hypothetical protein
MSASESSARTAKAGEHAFHREVRVEVVAEDAAEDAGTRVAAEPVFELHEGVAQLAIERGLLLGLGGGAQHEKRGCSRDSE